MALRPWSISKVARWLATRRRSSRCDAGSRRPIRPNVLPQELFAANAHQQNLELAQAVELCRADEPNDQHRAS
jgi:hypothetical protein